MTSNPNHPPNPDAAPEREPTREELEARLGELTEKYAQLLAKDINDPTNFRLKREVQNEYYNVRDALAERAIESDLEEARLDPDLAIDEEWYKEEIQGINDWFDQTLQERTEEAQKELIDTGQKGWKRKLGESFLFRPEEEGEKWRKTKKVARALGVAAVSGTVAGVMVAAAPVAGVAGVAAAGIIGGGIGGFKGLIRGSGRLGEVEDEHRLKGRIEKQRATLSTDEEREEAVYGKSLQEIMDEISNLIDDKEKLAAAKAILVLGTVQQKETVEANKKEIRSERRKKAKIGRAAGIGAGIGFAGGLLGGIISEVDFSGDGSSDANARAGMPGSTETSAPTTGGTETAPPASGTEGTGGTTTPGEGEVPTPGELRDILEGASQGDGANAEQLQDLSDGLQEKYADSVGTNVEAWQGPTDFMQSQLGLTHEEAMQVYNDPQVREIMLANGDGQAISIENGHGVNQSNGFGLAHTGELRPETVIAMYEAAGKEIPDSLLESAGLTTETEPTVEPVVPNNIETIVNDMNAKSMADFLNTAGFELTPQQINALDADTVQQLVELDGSPFTIDENGIVQPSGASNNIEGFLDNAANLLNAEFSEGGLSEVARMDPVEAMMNDIRHLQDLQTSLEGSTGYSDVAFDLNKIPQIADFIESDYSDIVYATPEGVAIAPNADTARVEAMINDLNERGFLLAAVR